MWRKIVTATVLVAVCLVITGMASEGKTHRSTSYNRYVAPTGADVGNDCLAASAPCATVQHAVDRATEGEIIKVAAGTYTDVHVRPRQDIANTGAVTQSVYISKSVTIQGGYTTEDWFTPDPDVNLTTLDAGEQGRVLYITGNVDVTVEGLHLTGGDAAGLGGMDEYLYPGDEDCGGGVYAISTTVFFEDNLVFENTADYGGGVHLRESTATLQGNLIRDNVAVQGNGGGVYLYESFTTLEGNTVTRNTAWYGGGLISKGGVITLTNNEISYSSATCTGGGVYLHEGKATLERNTIADNTAGDSAGGLLMNTCEITLNDNYISGNTGGLFGGGLFLVHGPDAKVNRNVIIGNSSRSAGGFHVSCNDAEMVNNVIIDNQATEDGGGLYIYGASPRVSHTTIVGNDADAGAGVYVAHGRIEGSAPVMTNTVMADHSVGINVTEGNTVTLDGVLWHDTPITLSQAITATVTVQNQHIEDPTFAPDGYHLMADSAAIDRGVDTDVMIDIDGDNRPQGTAPDLGADEYGGRKFFYLPLVIKESWSWSPPSRPTPTPTPDD